MAPIEAGAVFADNHERRSFTHTDGEDIYEIKLVGYQDGGLAHYTRYFKRFLFPKVHIGGGTVNVKKGEEKEISSTGIYAKGS